MFFSFAWPAPGIKTKTEKLFLFQAKLTSHLTGDAFLSRLEHNK
jgi:hypothetical protein